MEKMEMEKIERLNKRDKHVKMAIKDIEKFKRTETYEFFEKNIKSVSYLGTEYDILIILKLSNTISMGKLKYISDEFLKMGYDDGILNLRLHTITFMSGWKKSKEVLNEVD